jgi:hypothetical protein
VPPTDSQRREERRVEQLNREVYGAAWAWLPTPVWLTLVDPAADGSELGRLIREWETRRAGAGRDPEPRRGKFRGRALPVLRT